MNYDHQQASCRTCTHRKIDSDYNGFICKLTNAPGEFEENCDSLIIDKEAVLRIQHIQEFKSEIQENDETGGLNNFGIKDGRDAGIIFMTIAAIWFTIGLKNNLIFFYPFIMFGIGLMLLIKGINKRKKNKKEEN